MASESTVRVDTFQAIYTLINANKLTGWTVVSSFPETEPSFPCIVINPANISSSVMTLNNGKRNTEIRIVFELYASSRDGKQKIDQGSDNLTSTFTTNDLISTSTIVFHELNDLSSDMLEFAGQKLNNKDIEGVFSLIT